MRKFISTEDDHKYTNLSYAKALRKTSDEASFCNHSSDEESLPSSLSYLWHVFLTYITLQAKFVDHVVGLVVIDEPRPTGTTPEKASSGSSSSDRAAHHQSFHVSIQN